MRSFAGMPTSYRPDCLKRFRAQDLYRDTGLRPATLRALALRGVKPSLLNGN